MNNKQRNETEMNAAIDKLCDQVESLSLGHNATFTGSYVVTSGDVTATKAVLVAAGIVSISFLCVQIVRANKIATADANVQYSAGTIQIGSGSTYVLTAGDVIQCIASGQGA